MLYIKLNIISTATVPISILQYVWLKTISHVRVQKGILWYALRSIQCLFVCVTLQSKDNFFTPGSNAVRARVGFEPTYARA